MKGYIIYLGVDASNDLEFETSTERDKLIINHKDSEVYTVDEFITAFNSEVISDLGYIAYSDTCPEN